MDAKLQSAPAEAVVTFVGDQRAPAIEVRSLASMWIRFKRVLLNPIYYVMTGRMRW